MGAKLKFYLGERHNPQFDKPYYIKYGQLTKINAKKHENCIYGSMVVLSFETEETYNNAIADYKANGFRVQ